MKRYVSAAIALALAMANMPAGAAEKKLRVGWCTPSLNSAAAPWAVMKKMGWDKQEGIDVELVPVATGIDCVKFVATGEFPYAVPSIEPVAGLVAQGMKARFFYNFTNGTGWGVAVPVVSPIKTIADLKGKKIGVISLAAVGATVTKGLAKEAGLDPARDISLITVGEAARAMLLLRNQQVDAVSLFELAHLSISAMGVKVRILDAPSLADAPQTGLIATDAYLASHRDEAVALGRAVSKGAAFMLANNAAALDILYKMYPQTLPTGRSREETEALDTAFLARRNTIWARRDGAGGLWGQSNMGNVDRYLAAIAEWGLTSRPVKASEFVTNDLVADINRFSDDDVAAAARAYRP